MTTRTIKYQELRDNIKYMSEHSRETIISAFLNRDIRNGFISSLEDAVQMYRQYKNELEYYLTKEVANDNHN